MVMEQWSWSVAWALYVLKCEGYQRKQHSDRDNEQLSISLELQRGKFIMGKHREMLSIQIEWPCTRRLCAMCVCVSKWVSWTPLAWFEITRWRISSGWIMRRKCVVVLRCTATTASASATASTPTTTPTTTTTMAKEHVPMSLIHTLLNNKSHFYATSNAHIDICHGSHKRQIQIYTELHLHTHTVYIYYKHSMTKC